MEAMTQEFQQYIARQVLAITDGTTLLKRLKKDFKMKYYDLYFLVQPNESPTTIYLDITKKNGDEVKVYTQFNEKTYDEVVANLYKEILN